MRAIVQRVCCSSVKVDNELIAEIGNGLLILLGVEDSDSDVDVKYLAEKISNLRIFEDDEGKMNLSLVDVDGDLLIVSQFTLYGDCRKGRRPSFIMAGKPDYANFMYEKFADECRKYVKKVETGKFQADMHVSLINKGPVTIILDSKKNF